MMKDSSWCDLAVSWFEKNYHMQYQGVCKTGSITSIKEDIKKTVDINISMFDLKCNMYEMKDSDNFFIKIFEEIHNLYNEYIKKYQILEQMSDELELMPRFNMQKYVDGHHFKQHHFESSGRFSRHRVLTWMVYLNDLEKTGETYFPYYDLKVKPQKGKILIWPAEFTHTHCGEMVSQGETKYIMTGWIGFLNSCVNEVYSYNLPKYMRFSV